MKNFCYLGDRLNARGRSEAKVRGRRKLEQMKLRECKVAL